MEKRVIELDTATINKIAAGEVIERPASVVKELIENSIDANSTQITINIQEGGKKAIEIIDNGVGISHDDVILSLQRHTTSKIKTADDLFAIHTLGFRGEALASIVSVAIVDIYTRTKEEELGTHVIIEGGTTALEEQTSIPIGTRILVKNLFFNVPVRKKFLKTTSTEVNHITEYVTKLALSHPQIAFSLKHNEKSIITAPKGDLLSQIATIFGNNIAKACFPVNNMEESYFLKGYITKPEYSRKSRDYIYIYINNRPITDKIITDAILKGYGTSMPDKRFPIVFLFINIPADEIDVNVHPTKREVRFNNETKIFRLVETGVRESLEKSGLKVFERVEHPHSQTQFIKTTPTSTERLETKPPTSLKSGFVTSSEKPSFKLISKRDQPLQKYIHKETEKKLPIHPQTAERRSIRVLGIIKNTYIIAETQEGLLLCDQHAAHEKINYLKYLNQIKNKKIAVQQLLAPVSIEIKPSEIELYSELKEKLKTFGFDVDIFGRREVIIRSIPSILGKTISALAAKDVVDIFKDYATEIRSEIDLKEMSFIKDIVSLFACRRSIKAGDRINLHQAESLIVQLLKEKDPFACPHGRPTLIILNAKYLEELFLRDYK